MFGPSSCLSQHFPLSAKLTITLVGGGNDATSHGINIFEPAFEQHLRSLKIGGCVLYKPLVEANTQSLQRLDLRIDGTENISKLFDILNQCSLLETLVLKNSLWIDDVQHIRPIVAPLLRNLTIGQDTFPHRALGSLSAPHLQYLSMRSPIDQPTPQFAPPSIFPCLRIFDVASLSSNELSIIGRGPCLEIVSLRSLQALQFIADE